MSCQEDQEFDPRSYNKVYRRFRRNFDTYLEEAFRNKKEMTIEEISKKLAELTKEDEKIGRPIHLGEETLRNCLVEYKRDKSNQGSLKEIYRLD